MIVVPMMLLGRLIHFAMQFWQRAQNCVHVNQKLDLTIYSSLDLKIVNQCLVKRGKIGKFLTADGKILQ